MENGRSRRPKNDAYTDYLTGSTRRTRVRRGPWPCPPAPRTADMAPKVDDRPAAVKDRGPLSIDPLRFRLSSDVTGAGEAAREVGDATGPDRAPPVVDRRPVADRARSFAPRAPGVSGEMVGVRAIDRAPAPAAHASGAAREVDDAQLSAPAGTLATGPDRTPPVVAERRQPTDHAPSPAPGALPGAGQIVGLRTIDPAPAPAAHALGAAGKVVDVQAADCAQPPAGRDLGRVLDPAAPGLRRSRSPSPDPGRPSPRRCRVGQERLRTGRATAHRLRRDRPPQPVRPRPLRT